jgi:3-hydroxybutyryl-CoA dehydrogenase
MTVYNLNPDPATRVLLMGDDDFVLAFADLLDARSVHFDIFPTFLDDAILDDADVDPTPADDAKKFGRHAHRLVDESRARMHRYTHIVDLSVASPEDRIQLLHVVGSVNPRATILASTLTITATELGSMSFVGDRIVGFGAAPGIMHAATAMEFAPGLNCTEEHALIAERFLTTLGWQAERVEDRVALVHMRILATLINEAAFAVLEGVATPADIDQAMKLGVNYPKGLLEWADEIGLSIVTLILDSLHAEYRQERYRPCVLLRQYMRAGWNGKRSGRGFYTYA